MTTCPSIGAAGPGPSSRNLWRSLIAARGGEGRLTESSCGSMDSRDSWNGSPSMRAPEHAGQGDVTPAEYLRRLRRGRSARTDSFL